MSIKEISEDTARAATLTILQNLFWVYPRDYREHLGAHLVVIIEAATECALLRYQEAALTPSRN